MATKNEYKNFSLGPAGEASPAYLPPGKIPEGLYIIFPQPPSR